MNCLSGCDAIILLWTSFSSMSSTWRRLVWLSVRNTTTLSILFMNSGENFLFATSMAVWYSFRSRSARFVSSCRTPEVKPMPPLSNSHISTAPRLDVIKMTQRDKSTLRLSPSVRVALSKIPNKSCHSASFAFSISSKRIKLKRARSV